MLRSQRLNQSRDFDRLFKKATRSSDELVTVLARRNGNALARLGMAISRKCAPRAVDRNRLKRVIRESFRQSSAELSGLDLMVIGKRRAKPPSSGQLRASLERHWLILSRKCKRC